MLCSSYAPRALALSLLLAGCLAGCERATEEIEYTPPEGPPAAACEETDFAGSPLQGPGFADGVYIGPTDAPVVASSTVLFINERPDSLARFQTLLIDIEATLMASDGILGVAFGGSVRCGSNRTMTVWRDQASMMRFVVSDAHLAAIEATPEIAGPGTKTVHWMADPASDAMDWAEGLTRLGGAADFLRPSVPEAGQRPSAARAEGARQR